MKILLILMLIMATSAIATDYKNMGAGAASFTGARVAGRLIENTDEWQEHDAHPVVKIVSINFAAATVAGYVGIAWETMPWQNGDTHAEIKSDTNARIGGAAIACGVTIGWQLFDHYVLKSNSKNTNK